MSLFSATLLPGLFLIIIGALFFISNSVIVSTAKALPRSRVATALFWGGGALWFVATVWNISQADLVIFSSPLPFVLIFAVLALAAFYYLPDFLAVRGLCVIGLLAAYHVLNGLFGEYDHSLRLFATCMAYLAIVLCMYLAVVPYRLRDFFEWLFARPQRARVFGAALLVYGLLLAVILFTY